MNTFLKKAVWIIMAAPAVYLALVWNRLPDTVALHFDLKGNPDRYGSKRELITIAVILMAVNALVYLLLSHIYRIDPKKYAAENKNRLQSLAFGIAVFMSAILCLVIYSSVKGNISIGTGVILSITGLLFAFMGNYMHNIKPNYFAGFRLPWTLENEENWRKTHALAGKLWFAGGLLLALLCLLLPVKSAMIVFFTVVITITLIPIIYSFRLFRKQKNSAQ